MSAGVCAVKQEYVVVINNTEKQSSCDYKEVIRNDTASIASHNDIEGIKIACKNGDGPVEKKQKLENEVDAEPLQVVSKEPKPKHRGQNKSRPKTFTQDKTKSACPTIINVNVNEEPKECRYEKCKYVHSAQEYLQNKPKGLGTECHIFKTRGMCFRGLTCRFGSGHLTPEGKNIVNEDLYSNWSDDTHNHLSNDLQISLQRRKYDFNLTDKLVKENDVRKQNIEDSLNKVPESNKNDAAQSTDAKIKTSGTVTDEDIIKLMTREKKTIDWRDKLYLSPLTTVGNLPFRRICKEYGVDITCGEMALCESILKGLRQEWALVKRHVSEDIFGIQICGSNVFTVTKVAQLAEENLNVDFVDLNIGCPIELIYKKGGGCGMLHRLPALESSIRCASKILSVPFTVKTRTGIYQDKPIAHTVVPKFGEWGASLVTVHGRSREQRYTRYSDWEYIEKCASAAKCPVFGNGDIFCYDDYVKMRETAPSTQGVMIGRGALIKPWIFTEIKEQKLWDISSSERFDILKRYTKYGLEHWGSDTQGVENTRRFLLEWLSFLYRYVPVGLLERPPQRINERPPSFFGRDDLETLMASGNCADWVKISEMLLGPVPENFVFLPKHKANSYK